jgi:hypothetical protein
MSPLKLGLSLVDKKLAQSKILSIGQILAKHLIWIRKYDNDSHVIGGACAMRLHSPDECA